MKMRILFIMSLGILLVPGVASPVERPTMPGVAERTPSPAGQSGSPSGDALTTRIYEIQYYNSVELADLIRDVTGEQGARVIVPDERSNRLIVTAEPEQMRVIERLIEQLDTRAVREPQAQSLMCRVYMLELPARDQSLKPFSVLLGTPSQMPTEQLLAVAKDAKVQIATLLQRMEEDRWELAIEGRAVSNDAVKQVLTAVPDSQIKQLKWDDEAFTEAIPAAQVSQLPSPLREHLRKFLGDPVQTVGYWFGSLSVPGDLNAPIGPWRLQMKAQPGQGADLVLEVRVTRESPIPFVNETQLLSNTIQSKAGRPIIIGYNRESYGTRVMGAMVILPEVDTTAPPTNDVKL